MIDFSKHADAEVICELMEPKPPMPKACHLGMVSAAGWWCIHSPVRWEPKWYPATLTLAALHVVETWLITLGHRDKIDHELSLTVWKDAVWAASWHATAEQKIKVLAAVIRASVSATPPAPPRAARDT